MLLLLAQVVAFGTTAVVTRRAATRQGFAAADQAGRSIAAQLAREGEALRAIAALVASDPRLDTTEPRALLEGRWPYLTVDLLAAEGSSQAAIGLPVDRIPFQMGPGPELHRIDGGLWVLVSEFRPGGEAVIAGRRVDGPFLERLSEQVGADLVLELDGALAGESTPRLGGAGGLLGATPGLVRLDGEPVVVEIVSLQGLGRWVIGVPVRAEGGIGAAGVVALGSILAGLALFWLVGPAPPIPVEPVAPLRSPPSVPLLDGLLQQRTQQLASSKRNVQMFERTLTRLALELRTALTGVIGYSELLKEEAQREQRWQAASDVDRVLMGARDAMDLVQDTLALVDMVRGNLQRDPAAFQLGTLVHDVVGSLRPLAGSYGTRIEVESGDLGSVYTDRIRLRHVLRNLVGRGVHATPGGLVRVRVRREGSASEPWICIDVLDDGPSLTPEQLDRIFAVSPVEASDPSGPGSSVRLLVARRFATFLGGELDAVAPPGGGTCLTLRVPARVEPAAVQVALRSSMTPGPGVDRR